MQLIVREIQSRFALFDLDGYLAAMRRNGVTHACALPVEPMARTGDLLAALRGHPEVIPFASIDFESGEDPVAQLRRHLAGGCRGLKLHPIMQCLAPTDERVFALFEALRGTGIPVLFHTGRMQYFLGARPEDPSLAEPARFVPLLERFPDQTVVFGHMGLVNSADEAIEIAARHPRVYLETSFQPASVVAAALDRLGSERLLLGSDWPASEARSEIAVVDKVTRHDPRARRNVLFENGARLLRAAGAAI